MTLWFVVVGNTHFSNCHIKSYLSLEFHQNINDSKYCPDLMEFSSCAPRTLNIITIWIYTYSVSRNISISQCHVLSQHWNGSDKYAHLNVDRTSEKITWTLYEEDNLLRPVVLLSTFRSLKFLKGFYNHHHVLRKIHFNFNGRRCFHTHFHRFCHI